MYFYILLNHYYFTILSSGGTPRVRKSCTRKRKQISSQPRNRKHCPVQNCMAIIVHVPRHLRQHHGELGPNKIASLIANSKLKKTKRSYPKKCCPLDTCSWIGTRVDRHLAKKHKMTPSFVRYTCGPFAMHPSFC